MAKMRTTVTLSDEVLKAVKIRAARTGTREGEVIESALRSSLGLDLFEKLWTDSDMTEDEAMTLALEAQTATGPQRS